MASVNALARELVFKIVYYGPGLSGKTTTLQHIHATSKPEYRGKMVSLATPVDRTLYFDFLPIRIPRMRGMGVRLQLFTVPGQVYYNATRKLVLTGADGLVFVSDSQARRVDANLETLENLQDNLREHGRTLGSIPHIVHHNKRDLADILPLEALDEMLNPHRVPSFGTVGTSGEGVFEGLEVITKLVLADFESSIPVSDRGLSTELSAIEGGLAEALRSADPPEPRPSPASVVAGLTLSPPKGGVSSATPAGPVGAGEAPGERAARAVVKSDLAPVPFSLAELWPETERDGVREVELMIASRRYARAIELSDVLVARVLASAAGLFGAAEAPRDPASVPILLGLDGRRYLRFRALVRDARSGAQMEVRAALEAFTFAADARVLRGAL
jgi:signal recognition particle receptor subunit beta